MSMLLDFPFILIYLFYYLFYTVCTILNSLGHQEAQLLLKSLFFPAWHSFDTLNQTMCLHYINRIMMLLIVDIIVLLIKAYFAVQALLAAKYKPK